MTRSNGHARRYAVAALAAVGLMVPLAAPSAAAADGCDNRNAHPRETSNAKIREATLCLLNRKRAAHGARKLRENQRLAKAARKPRGRHGAARLLRPHRSRAASASSTGS